MINPHALEEAEAYTRQQEQLILHGPYEDLGKQVIASIDELAAKHVEPIVHELGRAVLPAAEGSWFSTELINAGLNVMVDPPLKDALPARYSQATDRNRFRFDGLLLPLDGDRFLKIMTEAGGRAVTGTVSMQITSFSPATTEESAEFRGQRAAINHPIEPGAAIFIPHETVRYTRTSDPGQGSFACRYVPGGKPDEDIEVYSSSITVRPPQAFVRLHQAFMRETRVALTALRTLL